MILVMTSITTYHFASIWFMSLVMSHVLGFEKLELCPCVALGENTGNSVYTVKTASHSLFKDNFLTNNTIVNL